MRAFAILGTKVLQKESSTCPPVLQVDLEATIDIGITNTSRSMIESTLYFVEFAFDECLKHSCQTRVCLTFLAVFYI